MFNNINLEQWFSIDILQNIYKYVSWFFFFYKYEYQTFDIWKVLKSFEGFAQFGKKKKNSREFLIQRNRTRFVIIVAAINHFFLRKDRNISDRSLQHSFIM